MLANNARPTSTISTSSSTQSLLDQVPISPTKKPPSSKSTLRKELVQALNQLYSLEQDQTTIKKINVTLTSELKTVRQQLKSAQSALAAKEEHFWRLARKVNGDESTGSDIDRILEIAGRASASHKGGLIGRIEELSQDNRTEEKVDHLEVRIIATSPTPPSSDEILQAIIQTLYADTNRSDAFATPEDAWRAIQSDLTVLKQQLSEQSRLVKSYELQIQELQSQHKSYQKLLEGIAQEASTRTSQLDAEKNMIIKEALARTSASDNERLRIENDAKEMILQREQEVIRLSQEVQSLRNQSTMHAELEAKLSHMSRIAYQNSPRFFRSQTLGRLIYGDLHKVYSSNWTPDTQANECYDCGNFFNLISRRHHCRKCGHVFCGSHIKNRLPLSLGSLDYSREYGLTTKVCDTCFHYIQDHFPVDLESVHTTHDHSEPMNVDT